jgi:glycosyltransferase involved in cell wall biosynthesis
MNHSKQPLAVWFPAIRAGSGVDVFTEQLAEGLRQHGIRAEITWLPHRAEYAPWTVRVPNPPAWATVTHVNSWLPRRFLPEKLPIVATIHSCTHDPKLTPNKTLARRLYHRFWVKALEQAVVSRASKVVAVSQYAANIAKSAFQHDQIEVIYNGIHVEDPAPKKTKPHQPFRLIYVGNWTELKGVDLLAPIMETLGEQFVLAYTTDRHGKERDFVLPTNTNSLGRLHTRESITNAYHWADALLLPSRSEGFSLVAIEAQACGLPVIATNATAIPEVAKDGLTGYLCAINDVNDFVEAIKKLKSDTSQYHKMSIAARENVQSNFTLDKTVCSYINLYEELAGKKSNNI